MKHLLALSVLLLSSECFGARNLWIDTNLGPLLGEVKTTFLKAKPYSSFRGIPYAKPPIGNLRYKPPVPEEPWLIPLDATADPAACPQTISDTQYLGDEDCLYINVFSPITSFENSTDKKAVMVWIHGGAYTAGFSMTEICGPDMLLEQDVVVVTFNYRLGALGFLSLSREEASGNAGLKDQVLALKWVQQNIATFGGDPSRVTIFGEDAGGALVHFHVLSPMSEGLFVRAIAMSGTALMPWAYYTPEQSLDRAKQLASFLGNDTLDSDSLLQFYMNAPAEDLVNGTSHMDGIPGILTVPFRPTREMKSVGNKQFLTECPLTSYKTGRFNKVPIMMGHTKEEIFSSNGSYTRNDTWTNIDRLLSVDQDVFDRFVKGKQYSVFLTDWYYTAPHDLTRRLIKEQDRNLPIYSYIHTYDSPYALHRQMGTNANATVHVDDLQYVFHVSTFREPTDPDDPVNVFRTKVSAMWANFAKYGNPTPSNDNPSNVIWQESGEQGLQMNINAEDKIQKPDISQDARQLVQYQEETLCAHPPHKNLDVL